MNSNNPKKMIAVLGQILLKLNLGQKTITLDDVIGVVETEPLKSITSKRTEFQKIFQDLQQQNIVIEDEEDVFNITVDVPALREYILTISGHNASDNEKGAVSAATSKDVIKQEWTLKDNNYGEDASPFKNSQTSRRSNSENHSPANRKLFDLLDDDDEEDDDINIDDDDDDIDIDDIYDDTNENITNETIENLLDIIESADGNSGIEYERQQIIKSLKSGVNVDIVDKKIFVDMPSMDIYCTDKQFELVQEGVTTYFTDQGETIKTMRERGQLEEPGVKHAIDEILSFCPVELVGDKLRIEVDEPVYAYDALMFLYAARERILYIDADMISSANKQWEEEQQYWDAIKQVMKDNKNSNIQQAIRCAKKHYNTIKNGGDFDAISKWVNAIKVLSSWTNEEYEFWRKELFGVEEKTNNFNKYGWKPELQKKIEATVDKIASADYDYEGKESWENQVMDVIEQIVGIDQSLNREQAVEIAKMLLEKTTDSMKRTIFLRTKREFEVATDQEYNLLRKQIFS